jgi:hypothetical protein
MKKQSHNESDFENSSHIAKKRRAEQKQSQFNAKNPREVRELISEDEDDLDYDPAEYARYIR